MSYKMINNLLGWLMFLVALVVYSLTLEPSVSLWDCGEFISASYKLQVVHPPGAPLFLLLGRLFAMFASEPAGVSVAVNFMSAVCSAFTVLFTFWITTHFAKKMVKDEAGNGSRIAIFASGAVAALALTFSDSFWFSAVEAEVYAMSSFFTALTFWAALRWEESSSKYANKWLVLIAYLIGLAIGTHLLNLLVIPAVVFIYYYKHYKHTTKGFIYSFLIGLAILFFVQKAIIPGVPQLMATMDIMFVNDLGLPFNSGSLAAILIFVGATAYGIYYFSKVNPNHLVNLAFVCLAYVLFGYSSYAMVVVRSLDNPAIDMNNPEEPSNLLSYINREQYGDRPLFKGPYFNAQPIDVEDGNTIYSKDSASYVAVGTKKDYIYESKDYTFFPRMGPADKPEQGYYSWGNMSDLANRIEYLEQGISQTEDENQKSNLQEELKTLKAEKPKFLTNNLAFLFSYQLGHMYFRYFMWNFVGRQNDQQGHDFNSKIDGNWISGIKFLDAMRLGPQTELPAYLANNQARNKFYFIPLILGIIGLVFHFKKGKNDAIITLVLFVFTGILINIFLNQPPYEPRERDYSIVGSFQTFCIWIGLGVLFIWDALRKRVSGMAAASIAAVAALSAPALMGSQGWDDHDRSQRYIGIDFAKNCLMSCPPNAILFTNGDNDTYPLWYAQNVEGFRTDVRIINQSLLPTDWYSQVLLTKVYNSEPLPLTLTKRDLASGTNDYYQYSAGRDFAPIDLSMYIKQLTSERTSVYSNTKYKVPVNKAAVLAAGIVKESDTANIVNELIIDFPKRTMNKGDLVLLDLIASNAATGWKRPICFTTTSGSDGFMNLEPYFERKGLTYQLVPIKSAASRNNISRIDDEMVYNNLMKVFKYSGMKEKKHFFLDDKATTGPYAYQELFITLSGHYLDKMMEIKRNDSTLSIAGNKEKVEAYKTKITNLLNKCDTEIPESVYHTPSQTKYYIAMIWHEIGNNENAGKNLGQVYATSESEINYYLRFSDKKTRYMRGLAKDAFDFMERSTNSAKEWGLTNMAGKFEKTNKDLSPKVNNFVNSD